MDLVFPVFVRASDSAPSLTPPEPQKSLWQLVIEAGPDDTLQRPTSHAMVTGHYTGREGDGSRGEGESSEAAITAATVPLSTRSSWAPPSYMVKNLMAPGFVERFCAMHGIECSAQVPPPPCLRLEDLQLPPFIVKRLREQLRQDDGRPWASTKAADKPRLEELREVVFGKMQEAHDSAVADNKIAGNAKLDEAQKHEDCEVTLTAIQQLTLTSMLLGHHTVTIAPCKAGKKTASLLATAVLLLSREMCDPKAESPKSHRDETEREHGVEEQMNVRKALHSVSSKAPCAVILVGSYGEVHQCSQWLQNVFTADAFCLVTFRRGSAELVPLPRHVDPSFACTASASAGMPTQSISMTRVSPSLTLDALHECKSQSFFFNDEQSQKTAQSERCGTQHASHRTERKRSREMSPIVCDYGCNGRGRSHSRERERELGREYRRGRSHSRERELGMDRRRGRSHSRERERELGMAAAGSWLVEAWQSQQGA
ncbi:hypothetical protein ERJ75_001231500 [Trypanosoma vivax]|nr:hypothetical protein ERJ75_001231500 [Trypanosoma vivax]